MKMKASGLHPNVTGCILPANLPTTIKDEAMKHFSQVLIQGVLKISEEYFIKSQAIPKPDSAPPSDAEDEDHKDVWDIGAEISFGKTLQRRA